MRNSYVSFFFALSYVMLCLNSYPVFAKAPTTAKVAFGSARDGNREIYVMNPDGTQQTNLTRHKADDVAPAWSPTGEQVLFASDRDRFLGSWDLYLMDPNGQNVRPVFGKSADRFDPSWSPNGKQIAYAKREHGQYLVYIADIDGKNEERVAIGGTPAWSPDGTEIVFVTKAGQERWEINILNMRTRKQKVFFPFEARPTWVRSPKWSPSGDKLAFSWSDEVLQEKETVYIVNRDGSELEKIVQNPGRGAVSPVWSPHGDALLYTQRVANLRSELFKVSLDGTPPKQLVNIGFWNHAADWFDPAFALPVAPQPQLLTTQWGEIKTK